MTLILGFVILLVASAVSQETTAVTGTLTDGNGAVWPNASVSLVSSLADGEKVISKVTTDREGRYEFKGIGRGTYELRTNANGFFRTYRKRIEVPLSKPTDYDLSLQPCADAAGDGKAPLINDSDKREIIRQILALRFEPFSQNERIIFTPTNMEASWLSDDQRAHVSIMSRVEIQTLTEKVRPLTYFALGQLKQRGGCVTGVLMDNYTEKEELEIASLASSETVYEFQKISGRWVGAVFARYRSN
jgi:hypothetical protein